jgi:ADP-dependent NAD(P)H-hydrate dehydratase
MKMLLPRSPTPRAVTDAALRRWPLPMPGSDADKETRGHVLVVAGGREMPGAALLGATAALRAGAGKLTVATPACISIGVGLALPEARAVGLPETKAGGLAPRGIAVLEKIAGRVQALVIGPGLLDERATVGFALALLPTLSPEALIVLDAFAMSCVKRRLLPRRLVLTPHAGEMAHLTGMSKEAVQAAPLETACHAAREWRAVVVLKGGSTVIAAPDGPVWRYSGGGEGLATSGSGDTLAGIIGGLAARGAEAAQAAVWGVALHGRAGAALARQAGPLGYLARELPGQVPAALCELNPRRAAGIP